MPLPLCSSSTNHARLGAASPARSGLNPIFPPLAEAAVLGHGPAASGCFSGIREASAALEPALLPAKLLPFLQIFPLFFWKTAECCCLYRTERCWELCPERKTWDWGEREQNPHPAFQGWPNHEHPAPELSSLPSWCLGHFSERSKLSVLTRVPDAEGLVAQLLPW